ncbi:hypothetical protein AVEN_25682-1 [Araneus ventricosus]|uniref:Uncharacterized protein n=1 Tax=Araneus ventricosus TaxID=182803 RepID=A0A4Y2TWQ1_ARAVE|nr:hypothetical protein AVEN_25682-1 [Araneus ventricosus]
MSAFIFLLALIAFEIFGLKVDVFVKHLSYSGCRSFRAKDTTGIPEKECKRITWEVRILNKARDGAISSRSCQLRRSALSIRHGWEISQKNTCCRLRPLKDAASLPNSGSAQKEWDPEEGKGEGREKKPSLTEMEAREETVGSKPGIPALVTVK